ncbi:MAG: hypothetical protein ACPGLV_17605 [Bacteroidia bacterium]
MKFGLSLLIALGLISSCGESISKYTQFTMNFDHKVTIPANLGITLPFDFITPETETNSESEFAINDTRKELIEEILLEEAKLTITSPTNQTFGFLNHLYLYINASGLDEVMIAKIENIPNNVGTELSLEPLGMDFKEYIKKEEFTLRIQAVTDKITNRDVDIKIETRFFVDAEILGQ